MNTLIKLEILRQLRNRRFLFFSVIYPSVLYLLLAGSSGNAALPGMRIDAALYFMVTMAAFGAMTAVLLGNSERIAKERDRGWIRQLRLTPLPGRGYVIAKIAAAASVSLPSILLVLVVAATVKHVHLEAWQWAAIAACTWAGSFVFAALGVAIGYLVSGDSARPVTMIIYFGLALLGGLWMPLTFLPDWAVDAAQWLPTRAYTALGQAVEVGDAPPVKDACLLAGYLVAFVAAAAWLYRRDTRTS